MHQAQHTVAFTDEGIVDLLGGKDFRKVRHYELDLPALLAQEVE